MRGWSIAWGKAGAHNLEYACKSKWRLQRGFRMGSLSCWGSWWFEEEVRGLSGVFSQGCKSCGIHESWLISVDPRWSSDVTRRSSSSTGHRVLGGPAAVLLAINCSDAIITVMGRRHAPATFASECGSQAVQDEQMLIASGWASPSRRRSTTIVAGLHTGKGMWSSETQRNSFLLSIEVYAIYEPLY